jgi:4-alpha-glucanotransferase
MLTNTKRLDAFQKYCDKKGADLEKLAIFQSLYDDKSRTHWGGWRAWEEEFRNPSSLAVRNYAKDNEHKINFFKYMQFEAERQFDSVYDLIEKSGLAIGLYRDLAVGVGRDSAELWSDDDLFIEDAGAGAPPDSFFPQGQKWGLGAFNPYVLKDRAYHPFIKVLRANMKNSGALRIDHVMSLMRLYVIPEGDDYGSYIMYNFEDMLNIVVIESHLNKCMVVGESIGNVPEGFLDKIREKNIYALSVLWAERWDAGWGNFKSPQDYPEHAYVSVGTHDMTPLRMWWFGYDIALHRELGLISNDDDMSNAYKRREVDRWKLLSAMDSNSVWPRDNMRQNNYIYGEAYPEGIEEAVHRFMSRAGSEVFLAELENILHVDKLQNLPGVDRDKYPNWRMKLPVPLEKLEYDVAYVRNINAIKSER